MHAVIEDARSRTLQILLDKPDTSVEELNIGDFGDEAATLGLLVALCADQIEGGSVSERSILRVAEQLARQVIQRCDAAYWERRS